MRTIGMLIVIAAFILTSGCQSKKESDAPASGEQAQRVPEPDYITVQHILIAFGGSLPGKPIERNKLEARALAEDLFKRAQAGEDFDALVREYTDDSFPGKYKMANFGLPASTDQKIYPRGQMVKAFGDVGFPLAVGEVGMAEYDPQLSKYGWHIIKRVE
ncbi:MAG: peptidylprolyl isomerase [Candidatus Krumholzibacteria bacterium]|nr:peptidylprolyl isomerase [Candidatus Krumholzibacteria bacterium]